LGSLFRPCSHFLSLFVPVHRDQSSRYTTVNFLSSVVPRFGELSFLSISLSPRRVSSCADALSSFASSLSRRTTSLSQIHPHTSTVLSTQMEVEQSSGLISTRIIVRSLPPWPPSFPRFLQTHSQLAFLFLSYNSRERHLPSPRRGV